MSPADKNTPSSTFVRSKNDLRRFSDPRAAILVSSLAVRDLVTKHIKRAVHHTILHESLECVFGHGYMTMTRENIK